jgi:transcriptional regulator with XRE-family HTH domain
MNTKSLAKKLDELAGKPLTLGNTLNSIRLCNEMTLKEFAKILGVSVSYLSDIEHGRKLISPRKAYEYAEKLGYSSTEFVRLALQDETNSFISEKGLHANVMLSFT